MTAYTYVVTHPGFRAVKVGYASDRSKRLEHLQRRGWEPYRRLVVSTGSAARRIEQAVLFELRFRLYVPPYLTEAQMTNGGWTETSSLALISASQVWDIACEQAGLLHLDPTVGRGRWMRQPPRHYQRRKGDTPRYVAAARRQARLEQAARSFKSTRPNAN